MRCLFSTLLALSLLAACDASAPFTDAGRGTEPRDTPSLPLPDAPPPERPSVPVGETITRVVIEDTSGTARTQVLATFAMPFARGDVPASYFVVGRAAGMGLATQLDAKVHHGDGSLRHGLITLVVPALGAHERLEVELVASPTPGAIGPALEASDLSGTGFTAEVGFASSAGTTTATFVPSSDLWMHGPLATEWSSLAEVEVDGRPLAVRFDVRFTGAGARVGVAVENAWAFESGPRNVTYDAVIRVAGAEVLSVPDLTHYARSRWHRVTYWGPPPDVHVVRDPRYLIFTGAVPAYDLSVAFEDADVSALVGGWDGAAPMSVGLPMPYMPTTGGRREIGPLPSWDALYVLSADARLWPVIEGSADLAGSWPIHYRDRATGLPPTLDDHPLMTILGEPMYSGDDAFPACGGNCETPMTPDSAHQPSFGYLAYLLGGDRAHLEELHFWANYDMFESNPAYRGEADGLVSHGQVRGQAWSLRTLGFAAWITPESDPLHGYFEEKLANNIAWYRANVVHGEESSTLGALRGFDEDGRTIAPWMDDFFTWTVGQLVVMGYEEARELALYKAQFVVGRMTAPMCWVVAAPYHMLLRDGWDAPFYSWAELSTVNTPESAAGVACGSAAMFDALGLREGEMEGYADSPEGYPSNMQPALAVAAELGAPGAAEAWATFASRAIQPDYAAEPQFAIVPTRVRP